MSDDPSSSSAAAHLKSEPQTPSNAAVTSPDPNGNDIDRSNDHGSGGRRNSVAPSGNRKTGLRTLTEAQLEKKRANDREAQRAIRERTKRQIEGLEQRIRDLESGEAYRHLQDALKQKDAVEAENYELRHKLAQVLEVLRPMSGILGVSNEQSLPHGMYGSAQYPPNSRGSAMHPLHTESYQRQAPDPLSLSSNHTPIATPGSTAPCSLGRPWERSKQETASPFHQTHSVANTSASNYFSTSDLDHEKKRQRTGYDIRSPHPIQSPHSSIQSPHASNPNHFSSAPHTPHRTYTELPTTLPLHIHPTCRLDVILYDFISDARRRLTTNTPLYEIIGPSNPIFDFMLAPKETSMASNSLSELMIELLKGFSAIQGIPEKVGVVSHMFYLVQWSIAPSAETYEAIPPWHRPVDEQLRVPHPIWIDYLPWPKMRAKMVYLYPQLPLDFFFLPYSSTLKLEFHARDVNSALYRERNGELVPRPELDRCWRELGNWSLGREFARQLPQLAETALIRVEEGAGGGAKSPG